MKKAPKFLLTCLIATIGTQAVKAESNSIITLQHAELIAQYADTIVSAEKPYNRTDVYGKQAEMYDAAPLTPVLKDFMRNNDYSEGQAFLLEGGKTYYLDGQDEISKGFVLRTDPKDVVKGKRARVICGIGKHTQIFMMGINDEQWNGTAYSMFTLGRQPQEGEDGEIFLKKVAFHNIDFDNPLCYNYGDVVAQAGQTSGNYFINMYNNSQAMTLDSLVIENCSFKRFVRGFIREQGVNHQVWNHVLIKGNMFMDCGYYNQNAGGYPWIAGSGNNSTSNLYGDFKVVENTFYDSPFPAFFSETKNHEWENSIKWNITFSNNTLVNFNTRGNGSIFKMRYLPDGSVYTVENNLMVLCKQAEDVRFLEFYGADIRETWTTDGTVGHVTLNFNNNWSTNNDLTNGQIFTSNAWTTSKNNFGTLVKDNQATLNGSLEVNVANISATELMKQPCPPHVAKTINDQHMHRADALDGTATTEYNVNLYFRNTDTVRNSEIFKRNIGAPQWHKSVTTSDGFTNIAISEIHKDYVTVYNLAGCIVKKTTATGISVNDLVSNLPSGIYLIRTNGKITKVIK